MTDTLTLEVREDSETFDEQGIFASTLLVRGAVGRTAALLLVALEGFFIMLSLISVGTL